MDLNNPKDDAERIVVQWENGYDTYDDFANAIRTYGEQRRKQALEEAAKLCEQPYSDAVAGLNGMEGSEWSACFAAAIRKLKESQ